MTCRFAPTTSGRAHPGTLLAFLLSWLDARSRGARFILRMEDIDPSSVRDHWRLELLNDLEWFGLDWDELVWQSACTNGHGQLLDLLADTGRLYACTCSRSAIQKANLPSLAGGWIYPGTCRNRSLNRLSWRNCATNIRLNCADIQVQLHDESGLDLSQNITYTMGDPLLVRNDGSFTYQLAVVADDHASQVSRIVRGRDIASSTAIQVAIRQLVQWPIPQYRHHFLLLEPRAGKLSKFHQSVGLDTLSRSYSPATLRGFIAHIAGILPTFAPQEPAQLLKAFDWNKVCKHDLAINFDGTHLQPHN